MIISLATQAERRVAVIEALRPFEAIAEMQIHDAVDGARLTAAELESLGGALFPGWCQPTAANPWDRRELRRGEIGCALSHLAVWRDAQLDARDTLVFEDDAEPCDEAAALRTAATIEELAGRGIDWDLLYLGRGAGSIDSSEVIDGVVRTTFSYCTHGYVVRPRASRALAACGYERALFPVDELLPALYGEHRRADVRRWARERPKLIALAMVDEAVRQRRIESVIERSPFVVDERQNARFCVAPDARARWTPTHVVFYRATPDSQAWHVRADLAGPLFSVLGAFQRPRTTEDAATLLEGDVDVRSIAVHLAELGLLVAASAEGEQ
ncbi:MAG: glycosyltransferase family 25 protein [Labilithrix sp.]|nr:glycosyltransferase family 25 protein [Labilithrix sp.]